MCCDLFDRKPVRSLGGVSCLLAAVAPVESRALVLKCSPLETSGSRQVGQLKEDDKEQPKQPMQKQWPP